MIDLSNNNGPVNFARLYNAGQRRLYLKCTEGLHFIDKTYANLRVRGIAAGFKVGSYHFAHPEANTPREEAHFFLSHMAKLHFISDLRPCLDFEFGTPDSRKGQWAKSWCAIVEAETGHRPVFYSYPSYIEGLHLTSAPGPLWLASFGRNDGVEHPFRIPRPFKEIAAHQYSSNARIVGVSGTCDISHVFDAHALALR